jgi:DNA polymerase
VDIYKVAAAATFGVHYEEVTKDQRQIGKVQVLALGYQGGIGAFATIGKNYGLELAPLVELILPTATSDELDDEWGAIDLAKKYITKEKEKAAEGKNANVMPLKEAIACDVLKRRWRKANPTIVQSWRSLEEAAITAVDNPGQIVTFNKAKFRTWRDKLRNNYLLCQLPSGRVLYYFEPQLKVSETPWGTQKNSVTCRKRESMTGQWIRRALYGGLACENLVQGLCRDPLAEAMLRVTDAGYPVVLHVHDELLSEVKVGQGSLKEFCDLMAQVPKWAKGLPIAVEGWSGRRYKK